MKEKTCTWHGKRNQVIKISVGGGGKFQSSEADVIKSFVVNTVGFIGILNQLVNGEGGIVGFDNGVWYLGGGDNGVGVHNPVRVFFSDLGDKECSHPGPGSSTEGVCKLESLKHNFGLNLEIF